MSNCKLTVNKVKINKINGLERLVFLLLTTFSLIVDMLGKAYA